MAQHIEIIFTDGHKETHFEGVIGADYTLCGHNTAGDPSMGWVGSTSSKGKVDCLQCIAIVEFCKKEILPTEYKSPSK